MAETIIYILFSLPGLTILIAAVLLIFKARFSARMKASMTVMLVVVALSMLFYAQYYNVYLTSRYSWGFDFLYCLLTPFCAPLYYLFINCLTDIKRRPTVNALVFLPSVIYAVLVITGQILMNSAERHAYICNEILGQNIQMDPSVAYEWMVLTGQTIFDVFMPVQAILVIIYGEFRLNTYIAILKKYQSINETGKTLKMREIHVLSILILVTGMIMSAIPMNESVDHIWLVTVAVLGQIIMVSLIVSYVMRLELSAEDMSEVIEEPVIPVRPVSPVIPVKAVSPVIPASVDMHIQPVVRDAEPAPSSLMEKIDEAMTVDNLFLQSDLSLISLCERVGTNRTYASRAIKDAKGCNFSDYVNRFRLDYALKIMKNTPKDKIIVQNIAVQCGCGSIQTFYRYFKLFYNETPTQWIERNK
jgi:AraC-like DNA-binding protein